jgi:hypothetical protein
MTLWSTLLVGGLGWLAILFLVACTMLAKEREDSSALVCLTALAANTTPW